MVKSLKEKMLERRIARLEKLAIASKRRIKNEESFGDIERRDNIRQFLDIRYGYDKIIELFNNGAGDTNQLRKIVEDIVGYLTENDLWHQLVVIIRDVLTHEQLVDVLANMVFSKKLTGNYASDINNAVANNLTQDQVEDILSKTI